MPLFEAARWAPSSGNFQPWRFLYARRDSDFWPAFLELLRPSNQAWAVRAGALLLIISRTHYDGDGRACITHSFDSGAAWQNLALQARTCPLEHGDGDRLARTAAHGVENPRIAERRHISAFLQFEPVLIDAARSVDCEHELQVDIRLGARRLRRQPGGGGQGRRAETTPAQTSF